MRALAESSHVKSIAKDESPGAPFGQEGSTFPNDIRYYTHISIVLFISFFCCALGITLLNTRPLVEWLNRLLPASAVFIMQLYFWAALGGTVASYKFFAEDKQANEEESLKRKPDPKALMYPNLLDVILYGQRILFSGALGVIGAIVFMAGLLYFEAGAEAKEQMFLIVFSFLVGFQQNKFLALLGKLCNKFMSPGEQDKKGKEGEN